MGQKVNPIGFRLGINKTWCSRWYAEARDFGKYLGEDLRIRDHIKKSLYYAGISKIEIEKARDYMRIIIYTARPGIVIGRRGGSIDRLKEEISKVIPRSILIDIEEVKIPEIDAQLVAENIALQIERRVAYRRAMKRAISQAMTLGAKGIKIIVSGRLAGAEIARSEGYKEGKIPLQTLRADIDYALAVAKTTYGTIGVKVWIYKGDIPPQKKEEQKEE